MRCVINLWLILVVSVHSSLGDLVNIFENVVDSGVSQSCNKSLALYVENLFAKEDQWALRMLDATSKIPVGLRFAYNFAEMGDFTRCLSTESADGLIKAKYCLGYFSSLVNSSGALTGDTADLHRQIHLRKSISRAANQPTDNSASLALPTWAICLPSDCTDEDVMEILSHLIAPDWLVCQTEENLSPPLTTKAIVALGVLALFVVILVASTAYDLHCHFNNSVPSSEILVAFSAYTNGRKLFKINENSTELSCLNGLRVLSMLWVVIGHVFSTITSIFPVFNYSDIIDWANSVSSMSIVSGTMSVDTFFVVGGALLVYVFMKARRNGVKFNIFQFYFHRYLRLTPPLAAAVLVSATLLEYMGSGPKWGYTKISFQDNCEKYWWSTLLYIQNYVNCANFCIGQTWYLNIDMQLYIISPLILFPLVKYPKIGLGLLASCIVAFTITPFYIAYDKELSGILSSLAVKAPVDDFMNLYYVKTHTRAAPWFIGILVGYGLAKIKLQNKKYAIPKIKPVFIILLWGLCISVILACVYGGHSTLRGPEYDRLGNAFYIALVRPAWAFSMAWVIFACVMGYGGPINWILSLPIYQVLNRFTYSLYILHVTILYMIGFAAKRGIYFSVFNAAYSFWGIYMITFGLSLFWVLAFESPVIIIEKLIFKGSGKLVSMVRGTALRHRA